MKTRFQFLIALIVGLSAFAARAQDEHRDIYAVGTFQNWDIDKVVTLNHDHDYNKYSLSLPNTCGSIRLSVGTGSWEAFNAGAFGMAEPHQVYQVKDNYIYPISTELTGFIKLPGLGNWKLILDHATMSMQITGTPLSFTAPQQLFVVDESTNWAAVADRALKPGTQTNLDGQYVYTAEIADMPVHFRVTGAQGEADAISMGAAQEAAPVVPDGQAAQAVNGSTTAFSLSSQVDNATVTFLLTPVLSKPSAISVLGISSQDDPKPTGVENIAADTQAPVYYNMHGVRVDNPQRGLYIRVANGQTQKVLLR